MIITFTFPLTCLLRHELLQVNSISKSFKRHNTQHPAENQALASSYLSFYWQGQQSAKGAIKCLLHIYKYSSSNFITNSRMDTLNTSIE